MDDTTSREREALPPSIDTMPGDTNTQIESMLIKYIPEQYLPNNYYHLRELKTKAKAPPIVLRKSFLAEIGISLVAFSVLLWYFASVTTTDTVITSNVLDGYTCSTLNPRKGVAFISATTSENLQFSLAYNDYSTCMSQLEGSNVCALDNINPYIATVSPLNTNSYCAAIFNDGTMFCTKDTASLTLVSPSRAAVSFGTSPSIPRPAPAGTAESASILSTYDYYFIGPKGVLDYKVGPNETFILIETDPSAGYKTRLKKPITWGDYVLFTDAVIGSTLPGLNIYGLNKNDLSKKLLVGSASFPTNAIALLDYNSGTSIVSCGDYLYLCLPFGSIFVASLRTQVVSYHTVQNHSSFMIQGCDMDRGTLYGYEGGGIISIDPIAFNVNLIDVNIPSQSFWYVVAAVDLDKVLIVDLNNAFYVINVATGDVLQRDTVVSTTDGSSNNIYPVVMKQGSKVAYQFLPSGTYSIDLTKLTQGVTQVPYAVNTQYMVMFHYGLCGGARSNKFIELSNTFDFSVQCLDPNSYYYQSPNLWFPTPPECTTLQPAELLSNCSAVTTSLKQLVKSTCVASFDTICKSVYNKNPPFSCSKEKHSDVLTIISLAYSNTMAVYGVLTLAIASLFAFVFTSKNYRNSIVEAHNEPPAAIPYEQVSRSDERGEERGSERDEENEANKGEIAV